MVLPVLLVVCWVCLSLLRVGGSALACQDAARAAARAASRGEPTAVVVQTAQRSAPGGARVEVRSQPGGLVEVVVRVTPSLLGPIRLPAVTVSGRAVALMEPP